MRPILLAIALLISVPTLAQPASSKFVGSWSGTLKQGTQEMEIILNIAPADSGGYRAYFDLPSQNVRSMEIPGTTFRGAEISFAFGSTRYEGSVDAAGSTIAGKLIGQTGQETALDFSRTAAVPTLPATETAVEDPDGLAGDFTGEIEAGGGLEATIHLRRTGDGYAATMDVPAQGALGLSADAVTVDGDALTVTFGFGSYQGTFSADRTSLEGMWSQGGREIQLNMQRQ